MLRAARLAAAAALLPLPAAAAAAEVRAQPIEEAAADLAYGFCPLFLAEEFQLTSPELAARGFGRAVERRQHPQLGEMSMVTASRPDGELVFGGVAGRTCTVAIRGANRAAALARLRRDMGTSGFPFRSTPNLTADVPGLTVETFKAPVEGVGMLYVQLIQMGGPTPTVTAQLFAMEE